MKLKYLGVLLVLLSSCSSKQEQTNLTAIQINSNHPEELINWYVNNLGLTRSSLPNELRVSNEHFEIVFSKTDIPKPAGRAAGFFKYGFTTNRLDILYELMQANGVDFRGEPFYDDNLKQRSLVTLDSDGNRVQFFEDLTKPDLSPYFFSVITQNFDQALEWYQNEMGFDESFNLDLPERDIRIRLMKNGEWLLELLSLPNTSKAIEQSPGIQSISKVTLK